MLRLRPITLAEGKAFVGDLHRHHKPPLSWRFGVGVEADGELVGVAIAGRPVARATEQYSILEVTRLCTDGTTNACSMLYSAIARAAKALGYQKVQTYILQSEPGTSLKAAGWKLDGVTDGGQWDTPSRARQKTMFPEPKQRWVKELQQ